MANMSYIRFENTSKDVQDCINHLHDNTEDMSNEEFSAKQDFLQLCKEAISDYQKFVPDDDEMERVSDYCDNNKDLYRLYLSNLSYDALCEFRSYLIDNSPDNIERQLLTLMEVVKENFPEMIAK